MALAIRFEGLIRDGVVADYAELARLGHVTRARVTQIMNLRLLAPGIQEELLFLPRIQRGRDPIRLGQLQVIALTPEWRKQRRSFFILVRQSVSTFGVEKSGLREPRPDQFEPSFFKCRSGSG
jgi:hypothetical protein